MADKCKKCKNNLQHWSKFKDLKQKEGIGLAIDLLLELREMARSVFYYHLRLFKEAEWDKKYFLREQGPVRLPQNYTGTV